MSAKTSPARRAAFFAAVAETGNQTLACERAKVSRSWVQLHRSTDPAFRAELDAAIATARDRLSAVGGTRPDKGWRTHAGEELAVRGSRGRRIQVARARLKQWTPRAEQRFLDALAGCCNVKLACKAAGLSVVGVYAHALRWPAFQRRWDEALAIGADQLEWAMVKAAGRQLDPDGAAGDDIEPVIPVAPVSISDGIRLLALHQHRIHRMGKPLRQARVRTLDEVGDSILRKLEAIAAYKRHEARLAAERGEAPPEEPDSAALPPRRRGATG
jgi:hypothetical protein